MRAYGMADLDPGARARPDDGLEAVVTRLYGRADRRGDGLAAYLVAEHGTEAFAGELARRLGLEPARVIERLRAAAADNRRPLLTGGEAVALLVRAHGARLAFAYPGTSELHLCDALDRLPGIDLRNARGDKEAVFAAAGACLLRPLRAVSVLHGARGSTNATGAIGTVRRNETATVALVGLPSTASAPFLPPHGEDGLLEAVGAFARWRWQARAVPAEPEARLRAARALVSALAQAFAIASAAPSGPVLLGLPQDVLESAWVPPQAIGAPQPAPAAAASPALVRAAAALIASARRPVLFVDDYALRSGATRAALLRLLQSTALPTLQVRYARGPMLFERLPASTPGFLGLYEPARGHDRLAGADLLVTVEDRNLYPRVVGALPACRKIAITSHEDKTRRNGYLGDGDLVLSGDAAANIGALHRALAGWSNGHEAVRPTRATLARPVGSDVVTETAEAVRTSLVDGIAAVLGSEPGSVLVDDSQMLGGLVNHYYDRLPRGVRVFGDHAGFVGGGLATAAGLALAEPERLVVCLLGDQALLNGLQGLALAAERGARLLVFVCNNGGSVSLRKQRAAGGAQAPARYLDNVTGVDYCTLARGYGLRADRVEWDLDAGPPGAVASGHRLRRLAERAGAPTGAHLVELVVPADPQVWRGVWAVQGNEAGAGAGAAAAPTPRSPESEEPADAAFGNG